MIQALSNLFQLKRFKLAKLEPGDLLDRMIELQATYEKTLKDIREWKLKFNDLNQKHIFKMMEANNTIERLEGMLMKYKNKFGEL